MDAASGPVVPAGMTGVALGLGEGGTCVVERVAKTVGERVRQSFLSVPQPRFVLTDAVFELRSLCMVWIVAYVGSSSIGGMVGILKLSTSLLT